MKSLRNSEDQQELLDRLRQITPQARRQWGSMTPHQMICHLNDAFKAAMGERGVSGRSNVFTRTVLKFLALQVPLKWEKGFKTMPEIDQQIGGTKPAEFDRDLAELRELLNRFSGEMDFEW